jgi:hypothetical protein
MEGFTKDVLDHMNKYPEHVMLAMGAAVRVCPVGRARVPDPVSDDAMELAHAHIFVEGCGLCRKLFVTLLMKQ